MIKQLSMSITSFLVRENIIEQEKSDIYCYGFKHIFINLLTFIIISFIATSFNSWIVTVFFFGGFMPFRLIAGGYHAKTHKGCNIISITVYILNMILIKSITPYMRIEIYVVMAIFIVTVIFIYAPIDHKNRVLEGESYKKAQKDSRMVSICMTVLCIAVALITIKYDLVITSILIGAVTASVSIVVGSKIREEEYNEED